MWLAVVADNLKLLSSRLCFFIFKNDKTRIGLRNWGNKHESFILEDFGLNLAQFQQKQVWSCYLHFSKLSGWVIITMNSNPPKICKEYEKYSFWNLILINHLVTELKVSMFTLSCLSVPVVGSYYNVFLFYDLSSLWWEVKLKAKKKVAKTNNRFTNSGDHTASHL